ncbi:MAG: sulfotransferase [Pseudomonadota bacterium]
MIVSKQRSGTNHLVSLLKSHPQIACYGEVFRDGFRVTDLIGEAFAEYTPIETRIEDPDRFLDALEAAAEGNSITMGFKVFPKQLMPVRQIARRPDMHLIRLVRPNLLATYSSGRIAQLTGQGAARVGQEVRRAKLDFDAEDFERFMARNKRLDDSIKDDLDAIPEDRIFNLDYSDLGSEDALGRMLEFLGVEPRPMTSNALKRNPSHIVARFSDSGAVLNYLNQHDLSAWASE